MKKRRKEDIEIEKKKTTKPAKVILVLCGGCGTIVFVGIHFINLQGKNKDFRY